MVRGVHPPIMTSSQPVLVPAPSHTTSLIFFSLSVRGLLEGVQPAGESEDPSAVPHWGEALHVRVPGMHQGLQQRQRSSQTPKPNPFQRGKESIENPNLPFWAAAVRINTFPPTIRKSRFPPQSCWAEPWGGIYYFFTSTVPWLYRTPKWARALIGGRQRHLTPLETKIKPPCEGRFERYPALCVSNESFY